VWKSPVEDWFCQRAELRKKSGIATVALDAIVASALNCPRQGRERPSRPARIRAACCGSIKIKTAIGPFEDLKQRGIAKPDEAVIVESSSGNLAL
jgi:hypothetical protein